ncbi:Mediator of ErbB2-driven cell motility 1 [Apodemus speciosus]|uniref:Protein MEMO1 n=1 Tax=Apodemus speciosus TaxID=105296 RepID=A0ABQ0FPZ4_APOSI
MSNRMVCREASHAGSWYTASGPQLNAQLEGWLSQVQSTKRPARAIIAPHAGYTYCGSCAAHAYKQVDPSVTRRIFILGPSHHVPLSRCALSSVDIYRTPLYDLHIDQKIYGELWKTGMFERMSLQTDEDEHSIEMHLPYTAKAMESCSVNSSHIMLRSLTLLLEETTEAAWCGHSLTSIMFKAVHKSKLKGVKSSLHLQWVSLCSPGCLGIHSVDQAGRELRNPPAFASQVLVMQTLHKKPLHCRGTGDLYDLYFAVIKGHKDEFTIIPVLVGALSESKEQEFGKLFSKYLADPSNLFVVSSDFCHWESGQRFRYSYYDESQGEIYRSIEHLDKMGMSIIEQLDPVSFSNYLKKYHNTICGRHPIGVLLNAITELQKNGMNMSFSFLNYAQSSQCRSWQDSSVSYAAGALTVH